ADVVVLYDELDLAPGKVRVKVGGGAGGHNGIRSLDQHIGNAYKRVRIGIGHPGVKELVHSYVLGDFAKADRDWLEPLIDAIGGHAGVLAKGDDNSFRNRMTLAIPGETKGGDGLPAGGTPSRAAVDGAGSPKAKGVSHIRQARPQQPQVKLP